MPESTREREAPERRAKTAEAPAAGSVSPEGIPYQAPSRPYEEMAEPGQPSEPDEEIEAKRQAQLDEEKARYR